MLNIAKTFANDGWLYASMQNTDLYRSSFPGELSCLSSYSGRERKMRPGPAEAGVAWLGRAPFRPIGLGFSGLGQVLG